MEGEDPWSALVEGMAWTANYRLGAGRAGGEEERMGTVAGNLCTGGLFINDRVPAWAVDISPSRYR